jgi:hypothetical protein
MSRPGCANVSHLGRLGGRILCERLNLGRLEFFWEAVGRA